MKGLYQQDQTVAAGREVVEVGASMQALATVQSARVGKWTRLGSAGKAGVAEVATAATAARLAGGIELPQNGRRAQEDPRRARQNGQEMPGKSVASPKNQQPRLALVCVWPT